jgi:hypothetical protein
MLSFSRMLKRQVSIVIASFEDAKDVKDAKCKYTKMLKLNIDSLGC